MEAVFIWLVITLLYIIYGIIRSIKEGGNLENIMWELHSFFSELWENIKAGLVFLLALYIICVAIGGKLF